MTRWERASGHLIPFRRIPRRLLGNVHHWPRPDGGKLAPFLLKAIDDFLDDFSKLLVNFDGIVTVNSGD